MWNVSYPIFMCSSNISLLNIIAMNKIIFNVRYQFISKILSPFFLMSILLNNGKAQSTEDIKLLKQKIQSADSIVLIGHEETAEYYVVPDVGNTSTKDTSAYLKKWYKLNPRPPKFLKSGKINREIFGSMADGTVITITAISGNTTRLQKNSL